MAFAWASASCKSSRRSLTCAAPSPVRIFSSILGPKPLSFWIRPLLSAAARSAADVTFSFLCSSFTRLGPRPGMRSRSSSPAGSFAASCLRSGSSPVFTMSVIFSARSSPMPGISVRSLPPEWTSSAMGSG